MTDPITFFSRGLAVALLATTTAAVPGALPAAAASRAEVATPAEGAPACLVALAQDTPPAKCCLTNPGYSGTCEVTPTKDESCASIVAYLNNPLSQGKDYCGNTTIRGGWQSVVCDPK